MRTTELKKIETSEQAQKIKEDYMCGKCNLSEKQLEIICEKAESHKGCCAFKYESKKTNKKDKLKKTQKQKKIVIPSIFKKKEVK